MQGVVAPKARTLAALLRARSSSVDGGSEGGSTLEVSWEEVRLMTGSIRGGPVYSIPSPIRSRFRPPPNP